MPFSSAGSASASPEAFALTLSTAMIGDVFAGSTRDKWLAYQTAAASASAIVFVAVGGALGNFGWRGPFAIYAAPLLFAGLVAAVTTDSRHMRERHDRAAFPWTAIGPVLPVTLFAAILFYVLQIQGGVALAAKGLTQPGTIGAMIGLTTLATVAGAVAFRFLLAWPTSRLFALGFLFVGAGLIGGWLAPHVVELVLALAAAQFGCGMLLPTAMTWAIRRLPEAVRGRGTGAWQGVFSLGQFISPLVVTTIALRAGGILPAFGWLGGAGLAAALTAAMAAAWLPHRPAAPA